VRILVVEDERPLGHAIALALGKGLGAHVDLSHDGSTAVQLFDRVEQHAYELAILDWWVPPPTGIELLRRFRHDPRIGSIVMMSGSYGGPERAEAHACGADLYLEKPFSLIDLIEHCRRLTEVPHPALAKRKPETAR